MKIEIEVTNPEQAAQILSLLASGQEWPQAPSEASEGERVEKHAEKQEAPKKRGPGRPRMTEEEKAEAAKKRAAEKRAAEKAEAEEPEPVTEDDLEKDNGKALALEEDEVEEDEDEAPEADDSDEDDEDDSGLDPMEEAVEMATKYLRDGNGKEVRKALKSVGASRVSDLKGAKVQEFLDLIKSI